MEHTDPSTGEKCESRKVREMCKQVEGIKSSEEVSVRYMQEWEERVLDRKEAREEGIKQGIMALIEDNLEEEKSVEQIAEKLMKHFSLSMEDAFSFIEEFQKSRKEKEN